MDRDRVTRSVVTLVRTRSIKRNGPSLSGPGLDKVIELYSTSTGTIEEKFGLNRGGWSRPKMEVPKFAMGLFFQIRPIGLALRSSAVRIFPSKVFNQMHSLYPTVVTF